MWLGCEATPVLVSDAFDFDVAVAVAVCLDPEASALSVPREAFVGFGVGLSDSLTLLSDGFGLRYRAIVDPSPILASRRIGGLVLKSLTSNGITL